MADEKAHAALPQMVLRNLGDRSYEKRKHAALEVEHLIKELHSGPVPNKEKINGIINVLVKEYAYSTQANHRKGGLIGLAATAIALMDDTSGYLEHVLPPVLKCFTDQEGRVRYYACEALYNITKVARGNVLMFFNEIFDGLCKLYADVDLDVKNGAQLLDRLVKDVVTECEAFDVDKFIPLLRERIRTKNPFIRQLLVGWITVLDSVPDIDMLEYLPEYLGGLFDMLSDPNKDIRQQAYAALAEFLREINQSAHVDLGPMVMILVAQCSSPDNFTRTTVLTWIYEFIALGKMKLLPFVADMLGAALACISDPEEEIRQKAERTNESLLKLVEETDQKIDLHPLLNKVTVQLMNKWVPSRLASLRWISMLLTKLPGELFHYLNELFPALLRTLQDPDDQVVHKDIEVLARISLNKNQELDQKNFDMVLNQLMRNFSADRKFLETRGSLIIRQLSLLLNGESIYRALALILQKEEDVEFASLMVQTLNLIFLTSSELFELRALIKKSLYSPAGRDLFVALYKSWSHNPVATFSLCLLAQAYELAAALVFQMAEIEVSVGFLMQIDKLVQLLESPIFIHLRLQLLEPQRYPFLLKSLYGLLMLLPQSSAFASLKTRLESVAPIGSLNCIPDSAFAVAVLPSSSSGDAKAPAKAAAGASASAGAKETDALNFKELLTQFQSTQSKHALRRKKVFRMHSLLKSQKPDAAQSAAGAGAGAGAGAAAAAGAGAGADAKSKA